MNNSLIQQFSVQFNKYNMMHIITGGKQSLNLQLQKLPNDQSSEKLG